MAKEKPLPRITDFYQTGMRIGNLTPCLLLEVDAWHACRIKAAAARRSGYPKRKLYYEGGYLSEFALDRYLKSVNKRHKWGGFGSRVRPDFKLWQARKMFAIDAHSVRHRTLMAFKASPHIPYPVRRLRDPERLFDDYVFGASVFSYTWGDKAGSSGVAYWGAIERDRLVMIMRNLWGDKPIPTGQQCVNIPLKEFAPQLMSSLLEQADAGRRNR